MTQSSKRVSRLTSTINFGPGKWLRWNDKLISLSWLTGNVLVDLSTGQISLLPTWMEVKKSSKRKG